MPSPLPEYKNLTPSELVWADHFAETGNFAALRELRELSASRDGEKPYRKEKENDKS